MCVCVCVSLFDATTEYSKRSQMHDYKRPSDSSRLREPLGCQSSYEREILPLFLPPSLYLSLSHSHSLSLSLSSGSQWLSVLAPSSSHITFSIEPCLSAFQQHLPLLWVAAFIYIMEMVRGYPCMRELEIFSFLLQ